jgi:hypothetical protein
MGMYENPAISGDVKWSCMVDVPPAEEKELAGSRTADPALPEALVAAQTDAERMYARSKSIVSARMECSL